jgi:hypothetical protein
MAPAAKSGGKSKSGGPTGAVGTPNAPRSIQTRSQKAGLQVRAALGVYAFSV